MRIVTPPQTGSSPLARGTFPDLDYRLTPGRLIPARAGNIHYRDQVQWQLQAHPRSRGEHNFSPLGSLYRTGSSPLARGTLGRYEVGAREGRLIPARAGNIAVFAPICTTETAHPRSRGEHWLCWSLLTMLTRLIPARAGNIRPGCTPRCRLPAHPRSRGEHGMTMWFMMLPAGSSPLARGTSGPPV